MLFLILAQAAAAQPDIELHAIVDARSVRIEKKGEARLKVWANRDAGSSVKVEAPAGGLLEVITDSSGRILSSRPLSR